MESTVDIRKRIHEFIDIADERILRIINGIIDVEEQEDNYPAVPDWYYEKLELEREKHLKGETPSYTWEEVKQRLMKDYDL
ncbi:addiction module family protein [Chryseobacterium sp. MYb264]|uniref:addiction module family protein n=1 Tax=unclassified Chryseobacterium TaxID=2593645 RepID=UPI0028A05193|nr:MULTISPECIES: addiction module family protein [unclassified Chryseobacterium]WSO27774.1 addiction module family protein [Chryseobacterium sp. MYb264]